MNRVSEIPSPTEAEQFIKHLVTSSDQITGPALVLYFYYECPYCRKISKTFGELAKLVKQTFRSLDAPQHVSVLAVNTRAFPAAMGRLLPPASGVPHLVYYDKHQRQTVFDGDRTVDALFAFITSQQARSRNKRVKHLRGGMGPVVILKGKRVIFDEDPVATLPFANILKDGISKLMAQFNERLGGGVSDLLTPEFAFVCFVGLNLVLSKVYIIIVPKTPVLIGGCLLFGVVCGDWRQPSLTVETHFDIRDMADFLTRTSKTYNQPTGTNPWIDNLEALGYTFNACARVN